MFQVLYKFNILIFLKKVFLLANTSIDIILKLFFSIFHNINIVFVDKKLTSKFYITAKATSTIEWVELINNKNFTKTILNDDIKVFEK